MEDKHNKTMNNTVEAPAKRKGKGIARKYEDAVEGTDSEKKEIAKTVGSNVLAFYQMGMNRVFQFLIGIIQLHKNQKTLCFTIKLSHDKQ